MFTKTTLNKMKKAQVVEMYLALQAQKINDHMAMETDYEEHIDELEVQLVNFRNNEKLREEKLQELTLKNKELEKENEDNLASLNFYTEQCAELKDERKKLKAENEELKEYAMCHPCDMECEHCGLTITEDDLSISLDCGELTCESCFDEGYSKSIKEENKELQEKVEGWEEAAGVMLTDNTKLREQYNVVVGTSNKYADEVLELKQKVEGLEETVGVMMTDNTKLTEENKKLKTPDEVINTFEIVASYLFVDEESWYSEHFLEGVDTDPEDIPTKELEDCNYKDLRVLWDWLIEGKYEGA